MTRQTYIAEFIGTAALLATIIGSGIMGEQLAGGNIDYDTGANFRRTFQSSSQPCFHPAQRAQLVNAVTIHPGAGDRRMPWGNFSKRHV